jgi:hypothetical protein
MSEVEYWHLPMAWTDWGVKPKWAQTGMDRWFSARIMSKCSSFPSGFISNLTIAAPPSATSLTDACTTESTLCID